MIKFRHDYYEPSDFNGTNPGERLQEVIELSDPDGSEYEIQKSEKTFDIQEYIDSFADSVDINNIVDRFTKGDFTAIPNPEFNGRFIDITGLPDNIHELRQQADALMEVYNSLPENVKSNIGDFNSFVTSIDNGTLDKAFNNEDSVDKTIKEIE